MTIDRLLRMLTQLQLMSLEFSKKSIKEERRSELITEAETYAKVISLICEELDKNE